MGGCEVGTWVKQNNMGKLISGSSFSISATVPRGKVLTRGAPTCPECQITRNVVVFQPYIIHILYTYTHRTCFAFSAHSNMIPSRHLWTDIRTESTRPSSTDNIFSAVVRLHNIDTILKEWMALVPKSKIFKIWRKNK